MGKPSTFGYKSSSIPSYREGLRDYDADIIKARTFEEAKRLSNFPDRYFFSTLRSLTSEWTAKDPDIELRLQINHYLSTADFSYRDFHWIQCPTPYSFKINELRFRAYHEQLCNLINYSLLPVDESAGYLKRVRPELKRMLVNNSNLHTDFGTTPALLERLSSDRKQFLKYRLELNPEIEIQLSVFNRLMHDLREEGLVVAGSTLNRYAEMVVNRRDVQNQRATIGVPPLKAKHPRSRTDGIVLLTSEEDANRVLDLALAAYQQNAGRFNSREVGKMLVEVAPGVGVGDNHNFLGDQRRSPARLVAKAISLGQAGLEPYQHLGYECFKDQLTRVARDWNLNLNNLAFEL